MKKILSMVFAGMLLFTSCANGSKLDNISNGSSDVETNVTNGEDDSLSKIIDKGKLVVGTSADFPPYEFSAMKDGKSVFVGADMDMAQYIADDLGVELEIKDMDFKNLIGSLQANQIDVIIAGMAPTEERAKAINLTDGYYTAEHVAVVRKDSDLKTEKDLEGKSIAVQMGTIQEAKVNEIKDTKIASLVTWTDCLNQLKAGKVDAMVIDKTAGENYVANNPDLKLGPTVIIEDSSQGSVIGCKKGANALTDKLNEIIAELNETGKYKERMSNANKMVNEATVSSSVNSDNVSEKEDN